MDNKSINSDQKHILYVEDHYDSQMLIRSMLQGQYQVSCVKTTAEADEILESHSIDMVLMDLSLEGDEDGLMMVRRLRSLPKYNSIPIIAITAHAYPADRQQALDAGCDAFVTKPVNRVFLMESIEKLFSI
ncbi:MAG: response regulator [Candidatus Marinimicrobia bacterium]|nr:response regulator [Candidatus Neomarinimicrobiota bacterium]